CAGSSHPCEPRPETTHPTPATAGESTLGSLGVAENPLPSASTTATYDVSSGSPAPPPLAAGHRPSPAAGDSRPPPPRSSARRSAACALDSNISAGTSTTFGSP